MTNYFNDKQGKGENDPTKMYQGSGKTGSAQDVFGYANNGGTTIPVAGGADVKQGGGKPVVGFLVSVSRTEEGEYWVLHQGQNTIGAGSECKIILSEATVSGRHAMLAIHRNPNDGNRLVAGLIDQGSANGVSVNGQYIGFTPYQCSSFDKIKIGGYELLLILFDAVEHDLKPSDAFVSRASADYPDESMFQSYDGTRY